MNNQESEPKLSQQIFFLFLVWNVSVYLLVPDFREKMNKSVANIASPLKAHIDASYATSREYTDKIKTFPSPEPEVLEPYTLLESDQGRFAVVKNIVAINADSKQFSYADTLVVQILSIKPNENGIIFFEGAIVTLNLDGTYNVGPQSKYFTNDQILYMLPETQSKTIRNN